MDVTGFELKLHEFDRVVGELTKRNGRLRQVIDFDEKEKKGALNCDVSRLQNVIRRCEVMETPRSSFCYKPTGKNGITGLHGF